MLTVFRNSIRKVPAHIVIVEPAFNDNLRAQDTIITAGYLLSTSSSSFFFSFCLQHLLYISFPWLQKCWYFTTSTKYNQDKRRRRKKVWDFMLKCNHEL